MIGQGCPPKRLLIPASRIARTARRYAVVWTCALIAAIPCGPFAIGAQQDVTTKDGVGLRIVWGGGQPTTWVGSIAVTDGEFSHLIPLGLNPDDNVTVSIAGSRLRVHQFSPGTYNGCDVRVHSNLDAKLALEFTSVENPSVRWTQQATLRELIETSPTYELDEHNRLAVQRTPADELRVEFAQDRLIFAARSTTQLRVRPIATGFSPSAEGKLRIGIRTNLQEAATELAEVPVKSDAAGEIQPMDSIPITLPATEGVYWWELTLVENQKRGPFTSERTVRTRQIQFIALDPNPAAELRTTGDWQEVFAIDPTRPDRWTMRRQLNQLKLPTRYPALLGSGVATEVVGQQAMVQLAPKGWQAIPLPIDEPNVPYILEVEYVASRPLSLGLSLLEPNALGVIPSMGVDSGIWIPSSTVHATADANPTIERHRVSFWPSTKTPYVILANHDQQRTAVFGKVRLLSGPRRLASNAASEQPAPRGGRERLLFLERPTFAQALNAAQALDPAHNQLLDDWTTIHTAADRLVQYLQANGYSGLAMTIAADGTSIYPSHELHPTPRWDGGAYYSTGQDPLRKDVVDLLFRMFDRAGLKFLPIVEFTSRFPDLESQRSEGLPAPFDLVDVNGRSWGTDSGQQHRAPYNPLHPSVQTELSQVIDELTARYGRYTSFAGVGVGINGRSVVAFPDETWGWDEATVQQFTAEQGISAQIFRNASSTNFRQQILTAYGDAWRVWRAKQLSAVFGRMQTVVGRSAPHAKLYLIPLDEMKNVVPLRTIAEVIDAAPKVGELDRMGIDAAGLSEFSGIVLLNSVAVGPAGSREGADPNRSDATNPAVLPAASAFFEHASSWAHFEQFEQKNPLSSLLPIIRMQQLTPGGGWNRRRYASALAKEDCMLLIDGGATLPLGQESATAQWSDIFLSLPNQSFETVQPKEDRMNSPLVVRQHRSAQQSYFYAVNNSPWTIDGEIDISGASLETLRSLDARPLTLIRGQGFARLTIALPPFEIMAAVVDSQAEVVDFRTQLPSQSGVQMQREIQDLKSKLTQVNPGSPKSLLENPSMEAIEREAVLTGWRTDVHQRHVLLDSAHAYDGATSLSMRSDGDVVGIRSNYFSTPQTGRISVAVWVRVEGTGQQPSLQISIESAAVDADGSQTVELTLAEQTEGSDEWRQLVAHFDSLPSDAREVRVGLDLRGPGEIWIDRVEIHDRWLDKSEVQSLKQLLNLASYKLQEQGDAIGCLRILESYWPRFVDDQFGGDPASRFEAALIPEAPTNGSRQLK